MMKYLKILNIIDIPWSSAAADYALSQSKALSNCGHKIFFAAPKNSFSFKSAQLCGYKTIHFSDRKKILMPQDIFSLSTFCRKEKIDIINAHTGRTMTAAAAVKVFTPSTITVRTKADAKKPSVGFISKSASLIICGSRHIEKMYSDRSYGLNLKTIYKGFSDLKKSPLSPAPPYKIGLLGRLDPVKGHSILIDAAVKLLKKGKECLFYFAGEEANIRWNDLKKLIPSQYADKFKYLGKVNDPYAFTQSCHIGVIPSIASEAVSRAALEWISSARALICSDVGSLPEYTQLIFKNSNSPDLADKTEKILDFEKIKKISQENYEKAQKEFSFIKFKEETEKAFLGLV